MPRYQIRIPEGMEIEDFIQELSTKAFQMLTLAPEEVTLPPQKDGIYRQFHERVMEAFIPVVQSFRLCGLSNICLESLESTELSTKDHELDASPTDRVYQFFIKGDLDEFVDGLSRDVISVLHCYYKPEAKENVSALVNLAFRKVLGEYLYDCPTCGKTELCQYSQSAPLPVWSEKGPG